MPYSEKAVRIKTAIALGSEQVQQHALQDCITAVKRFLNHGLSNQAQEGKTWQSEY